MKKIFYFNDKNDLLINFCQNNCELLSKQEFYNFPEKYKNSIVICYGLSNYSEAEIAKKNKIDFIFIDNCFFGNLGSYYKDFKAKKNFYRIIPNSLYVSHISKDNNIRLKKQLLFLKNKYRVEKYINEYRYNGKNLILVPPTGKTLKIMDTTSEEWVNKVTDIVNKQNFKNIIIRNRALSREERFIEKPIHYLFEDAYATVAFNSMALVESLIFGVPVFVYSNSKTDNLLGSSSSLVSGDILSLKNRVFPNNRTEWLSTLSDYQFTRDEIASGFALNETLKRF